MFAALFFSTQQNQVLVFRLNWPQWFRTQRARCSALENTSQRGICGAEKGKKKTVRGLFARTEKQQSRRGPGGRYISFLECRGQFFLQTRAGRRGRKKGVEPFLRFLGAGRLENYPDSIPQTGTTIIAAGIGLLASGAKQILSKNGANF